MPKPEDQDWGGVKTQGAGSSPEGGVWAEQGHGGEPKPGGQDRGGVKIQGRVQAQRAGCGRGNGRGQARKMEPRQGADSGQ